jgi:antitoxin ParD1/3/4
LDQFFKRFATMTTMNISLTEELAAQVKIRVDSGHYGTASEVVREALRLLIERDQSKEALRREIRKGLDQLERGEGIPADKVWAELGMKS